jgi:hypothetical protein
VPDKRCSVKLGRERTRRRLKRLLPLAALVGCFWAPAAAAEPIAGTEGVEEAAYFAGTRPSIAFVRGRELYAGTRGGAAWTIARRAALPDATGRVAAVRAGFALVESRSGSWLRFYVSRAGRWRSVRVVNVPKEAQLGPAGMTLDRAGRPVVAYSFRRRDQATELWLAAVRPNLRVIRTRVTLRGFPPSSSPPASTPVLMPDGTIRVVQTFAQRGANAIFWRRDGDRWLGRLLYSSALGSIGLPMFPVLTGAGGEDLFLAWTIAYPVQRELHVVLTSRTDRSRSLVVHRNAIAAGLVYGPNGPEIAVNESVAGLYAGLVLFPSIVNSSIQFSPPMELDGKIVAYARSNQGWQVLLARNGTLEWFQSPEVPHVRILPETGLSGRVEGATGGVVRVFRERAGEARVLVAEATVGTDGRFVAADAAPVSGMRYRFVYEGDFPYSHLVREAVP